MLSVLAIRVNIGMKKVTIRKGRISHDVQKRRSEFRMMYVIFVLFLGCISTWGCDLTSSSSACGGRHGELAGSLHKNVAVQKKLGYKFKGHGELEFCVRFLFIFNLACHI